MKSVSSSGRQSYPRFEQVGEAGRKNYSRWSQMAVPSRWVFVLRKIIRNTKVSQSSQNLSYLNVTQFKINYQACEILRFFIVPPKEVVETLLIWPWKRAKANKKPSQGRPILQHHYPSCRDVLWEGFGMLSQHYTAGSSGFSMDGSCILWSVVYLL